MKRPALLAVAALTLTLAACSGSEPEAPPANIEENAPVEELPADETPVINAIPTEEPPANATAAATTVPDDRTTETQMYDDADATGMTARVDRDDSSQNAATSAETEK